jgi:hypothetical protein
MEDDGCANVQRDQACTLIRGEKFTGLELWWNVIHDIRMPVRGGKDRWP